MSSLNLLMKIPSHAMLLVNLEQNQKSQIVWFNWQVQHHLRMNTKHWSKWNQNGFSEEFGENIPYFGKLGQKLKRNLSAFALFWHRREMFGSYSLVIFRKLNIWQ